MYVDKPLSPDLEWVPALRFTLNSRHTHVFVEPSDNGPYPGMFRMRCQDVMCYPEPISIYCVCHDMAIRTKRGQADLKHMKSHGFGLLTVNQQGIAHVLFPAIPLVQWIPEADFKPHLKGLPSGICQPVSHAFEDYKANPTNGVKSLSEVIEGMITKAGKDSAAKEGITKEESKKNPANVLDSLYQKYPTARSAIGGARKFNSEYRNLIHHWPKNKKDSYKKFNSCKHQFLEGLQTIQSLRKSMKDIGLSGNVSRS